MPENSTPKDAPEAVATGYAVYDTRLQRYVSGVTKDKPKAKDGQKVIRVWPVTRLQLDAAELDRFADQLQAVGHQLADLDAANAAAARVVLESARAAAPKATGRLSGSITATTAPNGVTWASTARYWTFVHWGAPRRNIKARPFILEALQADTQAVVAVYAEHAETTLEGIQ